MKKLGFIADLEENINIRIFIIEIFSNLHNKKFFYFIWKIFEKIKQKLDCFHIKIQ